VTGSDAQPRATPGWTRLPALLLVAVASGQIWLAHSRQLSPWCGGGFGMFSTADAPSRRHLHALELSPGALRELEVPRSLRGPLERALALPDEPRLRALARELAATLPPDDAPDALELSVYATRFDPRTLAPSGVLLRGLRVPLRDQGP